MGVGAPLQNSAMMRVYDLKAGHSRRVLAHNNPVNRVDPTGLQPPQSSVSIYANEHHVWIDITRPTKDGTFMKHTTFDTAPFRGITLTDGESFGA